MRSLIERSVASVVLIIRMKVVDGEASGFGIGSGFCWLAAGGETLIVTNRHVVSDDPHEDFDYAVTFGGKGGSRFNAGLVGMHPLADIAVLRTVISPRPTLLDFRQSTIWPGEEVVAVGNPLGYTTSFSKGIISAVDRENFYTPTSQPVRAIQTDATVNRGNSGGPLLGMDGTVVGVNAHGDGENLHPWRVEEVDEEERTVSPAASGAGNPLIVRPRVDLQGVNFAVPADIAEAAALEVLNANADGVPVGELGIRYDPGRWFDSEGPLSDEVGRAITRTLTEAVGVELDSDPDPGSPAAAAGLAKGDVIISIDDQPVDHPAHLNAWAIKRTSWQRKVPLRFIRDDRMIEVQIEGREKRL